VFGTVCTVAYIWSAWLCAVPGSAIRALSMQVRQRRSCTQVTSSTQTLQPCHIRVVETCNVPACFAWLLDYSSYLRYVILSAFVLEWGKCQLVCMRVPVCCLRVKNRTTASTNSISTGIRLPAISRVRNTDGGRIWDEWHSGLVLNGTMTLLPHDDPQRRQTVL
jgi:hypothetical protein